MPCRVSSSPSIPSSRRRSATRPQAKEVKITAPGVATGYETDIVFRRGRIVAWVAVVRADRHDTRSENLELGYRSSTAIQAVLAGEIEVDLPSRRASTEATAAELRSSPELTLAPAGVRSLALRPSSRAAARTRTPCVLPRLQRRRRRWLAPDHAAGRDPALRHSGGSGSRVQDRHAEGGAPDLRACCHPGIHGRRGRDAHRRSRPAAAKPRARDQRHGHRRSTS